jgi:hypothetical protein
MSLRNSFAVVGIFAVFAVFFFCIRPEWIKSIASNPNAAGPTTITKVNVRVAAERLSKSDLSKDRGGLLHIEASPGGEHLADKIVEEVGDDLPSRNMPYLLVVNKSNNSMRYCRLGSGVRKATLRSIYPDVKFQEVANAPGGPYQVIIWLPAAMDLQMEFEVVTTVPTRS